MYLLGSKSKEGKAMSKIKNQYGEEINLEAAAMIMDTELCEEVHAMNLGTDQEWWDEYCSRHEAKYGDEFEPNKLNGQW